MTRQRKIVIQGIASMVIATVGIVAVGTVATANKTRSVAFEYREDPIAADSKAAEPRILLPTARRRPTASPPGAEEEAGPPAAAAEPKNGDEPHGLLEGIAAKMIDNAITTFWSIVNALIVAVTMRRYSKAGKAARDG